MTNEEFLEQYNEAPFDDDELADVAENVEGEVGEAAKAFTKAKEEFNRVLDKIGYERG